MPVKKPGSIVANSIVTKLAGFAIVTAVVVLGTQSQIPVSDQNADQIQHSHLPTAMVPVTLVPVDRGWLSQQILPAQRNRNATSSTENAPSINGSPASITSLQVQQTATLSGPSDHELRLEDQKAWRSQPRRASLISKATRPVELVDQTTVASNQVPIVPGHEDPHQWFQPQHLQLAADHSGAQEESFLQAKPIESVNMRQSHETPREIVISALPQESPFPVEPLLVEPVAADLASVEPVSVEPALATTLDSHPVEANATKPVATTAVRTAQAWETGRY